MLVQISRLLLSFLFIFGAISKLISMPFFDGMVAELFLGENYFDQPKGMFWIQWLTRMLVTIELLIGVALLQNKGFKKITLPATLFTLLVFTIHLVYDSLQKENGFVTGNCGCFGDVLPMTNLESIIKNGIGLGLGLFAWLKYQEQSFKSWVSPISIGIITLFTLSFGVKSYESEIINDEQIATVLWDDISSTEIQDTSKIDLTNTDNVIETNNKENIPSNGVKKRDTNNKVDKIPVTKKQIRLSPTIQTLLSYVPESKSAIVSNDTTLVCLFSMTCSHCQEVYRDLYAMRSSPKIPSLFLINYGTEYEQNYFFSQAGNTKDPHFRIDDFGIFKRLLEGKTYPRILQISKGKIIKEWDVDTYNKEEFMNYFQVKKLEPKKSNGLELDLNQGQSPW